MAAVKIEESLRVARQRILLGDQPRGSASRFAARGIAKLVHSLGQGRDISGIRQDRPRRMRQQLAGTVLFGRDDRQAASERFENHEAAWIVQRRLNVDVGGMIERQWVRLIPQKMHGLGTAESSG